jgi:crotonobetainyl-CoA:carnitine CoA-transferase CaiB-like acyl-CoA transferase
MAEMLDLTGQRFGKLLVLDRAQNVNGRTAWLCRCDCGAEVVKITKYLRNGETTSCGCAGQGVYQTKHGLSRKIPEYAVWKQLRRRCNSPTAKDYDRYGGRNIRVCPRWDSFVNFLADMGRRPSPDHSIERRDNNGDYSPENCVWATDAEQRRNKRTSVVLTRPRDGKTMNLADWARELGITKETIKRRLKNGWSLNDALDPTTKNPHLRYLTFNGKTQTLTQWARELGVRVQVLKNRLDSYGWSVERALTTPGRATQPDHSSSGISSSTPPS